MALRIVVNERPPRSGSPSVTLNLKLSRLTLNKEGYALLTNKGGKQPQYIHFLLDDELLGVVFFKPCEKDDVGSNRLSAPSQATKSCSINSLLKELEYSAENTMRFNVQWDDSVGAARFELNKGIPIKSGKKQKIQSL